MKSKWAQRNEAGIVRNNLLKPFAGDSPGVPFLHLKGSVVTPIHMFSHVKVSSVSVGSSPEGQFLVRFQWQPVLRAIFRGWTCIGYNYQRMIPNIKTLIYPGRFPCLRVGFHVSESVHQCPLVWEKFSITRVATAQWLQSSCLRMYFSILVENPKCEARVYLVQGVFVCPGGDFCQSAPGPVTFVKCASSVCFCCQSCVIRCIRLKMWSRNSPCPGSPPPPGWRFLQFLCSRRPCRERCQENHAYFRIY